MKVTAYITDCCNELKLSSDVVGVLPDQDLFDKYKSFPTVPNPEKTDIHYCTKCYNKIVLLAAQSLCNRKNDEEEYIKLIRTHAYLFKQSLVIKYSSRSRLEKQGLKK